MSPKPIKPRAVLYLRQSVSREESISLELQETAGRTHAEQHGYDVVAVESDPGISGRTWKRPAVQRVMTMIEAGQADVIVLWKWSRLSRSRLDWAVAADRVEVAGGRIESATEPLDVSTSTGRLARGMLTEFAAFESERQGDIWKEAHARRIKQGLPSSGRPRFGYNYDRETGYTPDPIKGPVLTEAYRRYNSGESFRSLALWLNAEGHTGTTGYNAKTGLWVSSSITAVLDHAFGAGYIRHHGKLLPGAHQSVITEAEWQEYQTRRETRRQRKSGEASTYLLTGMIHCKQCGGKMYGTPTSRSRLRYRYRCISASLKGIHEPLAIYGEIVEAETYKWLANLAADINEAAKQAPAIQAQPSNRLPALRRALIKTQTRLDTLTLKLIDETIPQDTYERMRDTLTGERERTEVLIREAELAEAKPVGSFVPGLVENWDVFPIHVKRDLLSRVVGKVEVSGQPGNMVVDVVERWDKRLKL